MLTGHLGDLGAALVDDQLDPPTRDLVLAHLAGCPGCRRDVGQQRQLKSRLRALAEPGLPASLVTRLSALNRVPELPPPSPPLSPPSPTLPPPPGPDPSAAAVRSPDRPPEPRPKDSRPLVRSSLLADSRRGRRLLVGAASLLLFGVGTVYAAAGDVHPAAPTSPASDVFTTSRTASVPASVPLNDPAFAAMTATFSR